MMALCTLKIIIFKFACPPQFVEEEEKVTQFLQSNGFGCSQFAPKLIQNIYNICNFHHSF